MVHVLSVSDVETVLAAAGYPLTARQIRRVGVAPVRWGDGYMNGGRLFSETEAALLAVYAALSERCRALELPLWMARAALRYREHELRVALERRAPRYLVLDPIRGTVAFSETRDSGAVVVDLRAIALAVASAVAAHRAVYAEVWTGSRYIQSDEALTV